MKRILFCSVLAALILAPRVLSAQGMARMTTVEPDKGKAGDEITVNGENLDSKGVGDIYLTDGKNDIKVQVVSQAATIIKFKIPASAKPMRYALMLVTKGPDPKMIEQPVKLTVE
ncbi:MAG: IPT/TIG domain-containing protein [Candidatus Solibacter usitatus]|nr:IPT/TIG domain-containing protein [Candidatus Solibacter usitatus]